MPHQVALVGRYLWRNNLPKATWNMRSDREQIPPKSTKSCSSKLHNIIFLVFDSDSSKGNTSQQLKLVGGFNPFEKYFSNWIIPPGTSPGRGIQFWDNHLFFFLNCDGPHVLRYSISLVPDHRVEHSQLSLLGNFESHCVIRKATNVANQKQHPIRLYCTCTYIYDVWLILMNLWWTTINIPWVSWEVFVGFRPLQLIGNMFETSCGVVSGPVFYRSNFNWSKKCTTEIKHGSYKSLNWKRT